MRRKLIITVAGTATRFNKDTDTDTLKCLYFCQSPDYSLLNQIIYKSEGVEEIIIVGGYLYDELQSFINENLGEYLDRITLVYNELYNVYGSGYSLIKGIEAIKDNPDEIIFVEGDLFFNSMSYAAVIQSPKDVVTINRDFITADKAVALYINEQDKLNYIYDLSHHSFSISEPIKAIYNSAQIWKFISSDRLKQVIFNLNEKQVQGTNLEIIQGYFGGMPLDKLDILVIEDWTNCNTVKDYIDIFNQLSNGTK